MKLYVDLHIHSALSPCASEEMTPCNIVNMAYIKGLDAISITDHNGCLNSCAAEKIAQERGIILLPGMEVQTKEEFHSLCYFRDFEALRRFGEIVEEKLPHIDNKAELFGRQQIYNSQDEVVGEYKKLLLNSIQMGFGEMCTLVEDLRGVVVPAHVNRGSFSIINSLGFIPEEENINTIEFYGKKSYNIQEKSFCRKKYRIIQSSDAHRLEDISEKEYCIEVPEKKVSSIIDCLKSNDYT